MARHFLSLYLLIVLTLAIASWGQDQLWRAFGSTQEALEGHQPQAAVLRVISEQLRSLPYAARAQFVDDLAAQTHLEIELLEAHDLAGSNTLARLQRGKPTFMRAANDEVWIFEKLSDEGRILTFRFDDPMPARGVVDWALSLLFYGAIALVIMLWLWPLTRDLRALERATARFGDRNWTFDADIKPRSHIYPLAQAFRRMVARIDALISSQKDMSNALSHEIKTPLARMRFEIELARNQTDREKLAQHLDHLNADILELNAFATATLEYAVLERAEVALNVGEHDFTTVIPAIAESVRRTINNDVRIACDVQKDATDVWCDAHLMETVLRNLLYNALRYARTEVRVVFAQASDTYRLTVEDDGPGIPKLERTRIFESFVQLGDPTRKKTGFGLGLAIVKRILEWHRGTASADVSSLGGAKFVVEWSECVSR